MMAASLVGELAKSISSGALIVSDDPRYEQARLVWNGIADRRPAAIVKARNSNDIRVTIKIAAAHGALLAVRCGGHSLPGLSTCDGGIVLDLSAMNSVTIDPATRTAVVGGGALLVTWTAQARCTGWSSPLEWSHTPALPASPWAAAWAGSAAASV